MNIFAPGKPEWAEEQYRYLGHTSRILRENTFNFISKAYIPLIPTTRDNIWVNQWNTEDKTIYTIYNLIPEGYKGDLFEVKPKTGWHFVDLWHHREKEPKLIGGEWLIEAETDAFNQSWLGTNNEGQVDCIAGFQESLKVSLESDLLRVESSKGEEIRHPRNFNTAYEGTGLLFGQLTGYPCCTSNLHQGWPKFTRNLWYASADKGIAALVYAPSKVNARAGDGTNVKFTEETGYPFDESIKFTFKADKPVRFPFHLRIPAWCDTAVVKIIGKVWDEFSGNRIIKIKSEA